MFNGLSQLAQTVLLPHMLLHFIFLDFLSYSFHIRFQSLSEITLFFTSMFIYNFFPFCSVWHIFCCLVGRLCSPVINLFCRSPSSSTSSYSPLPTFPLTALLSSLMHSSLTPSLHPSLPSAPLIANLSPFRLLPLPHVVLSEKDERGAFLYVWLICYVKTLANNRLTVWLQQHLGFMWGQIWVKCFQWVLSVKTWGNLPGL